MIAHYGKPFVLGGDWNASVHDISESGWPASIQGRIASIPSGELGTCRSPEGNWSCIDDLVMSRQLHISYQCVSIVGSEPPRPHLLFRIKLHAKPRSCRELTLRKCKQFPFYIPFGPVQDPPSWDTSAVIDGLFGQEKIDATFLSSRTLKENCWRPMALRRTRSRLIWAGPANGILCGDKLEGLLVAGTPRLVPRAGWPE